MVGKVWVTGVYEWLVTLPPSSGSREWTGSWARLKDLKANPQWPTSPGRPQQRLARSWGPSVQTHKPAEGISCSNHLKYERDQGL